MITNKNLFHKVCALFLISHLPIDSQEIHSKTIDKIIGRSMQTFEVLGISAAVIKDGNIVHNKGYGFLELNSNERVDGYTLSAIASNTKAFTCAAFGILLDEKKSHWNDRAIEYLPECRLYKSYVTEEFAIRDLLTHRSGLGLGAGDLMIFPDSNDFTLYVLIHNMRYSQPVSGFRSKYDYDNLLYIFAGEVVARVLRIGWKSFVEHIM